MSIEIVMPPVLPPERSNTIVMIIKQSLERVRLFPIQVFPEDYLYPKQGTHLSV